MNTPTQPGAVSASYKLYGLDHLRALAIILVFFYHYQSGIFGHPTWVRDVSAFGWTRVDLFFVLSGYLVSSQLFRELQKQGTISFKTFFIKRFFRIIPAYWAVLLVYFLVPAFHERETLRPLWTYLTFTQNIGLDLKHFGTFSHAWSLCVEEHFYLLLPLTLLLLSSLHGMKKGWMVLLALFLLGFLFRYLSWQYLYRPHLDGPIPMLHWYMHLYYPTWNRLDGLLTGVALAALSQFKPQIWNRIKQYGNWLIVAGLLALTAAYFICEDQSQFAASIFGFPLIATGYGLMVAGAISPVSILYRWQSSVTSFIAALSYAIYLSHKGVIHVVQKWCSVSGWDTNSNWMMLVSTAACVLAAWLMHIIIEKPFMKWRQKIIR